MRKPLYNRVLAVRAKARKLISRTVSLWKEKQVDALDAQVQQVGLLAYNFHTVVLHKVSVWLSSSPERKSKKRVRSGEVFRRQALSGATSRRQKARLTKTREAHELI